MNAYVENKTAKPRKGSTEDLYGMFGAPDQPASARSFDEMPGKPKVISIPTSMLE